MRDDRQVVVITGGSAGVGRATARHFAARGWRVAVLARGADGLAGTEADILAAGGEAMTIATDVADPAQVEAAAQQVEQQWGAIDVWVNNAMATLYCEVMRSTPEQFRRATEVTYLGTVWGTQAALRRMRPRGHGVIVQVGSALAYRSIPLQAAYCGAKSAIRGFTDALRSELLHDGSPIRLTMVQLSAFNTPQFDWAENCMQQRAEPVPPIFQPELAAQAIYQAALEPRREWWIGWPAVQTILAQRLLPGAWLDRLAATRGYAGELTGEPLPPGQPSNLFQPVAGDHGAHGRFSAQAKRQSLQYFADSHRLGVAALALGALLLAGKWLLAGRNGGSR